MIEQRATEYTSIRRAFTPPVDLDAGALSVAQALGAFGFCLGALLVACLGAWLARWLLWPGLVLFVVGVAFGLVVLYVAVTAWLDHRSRLRDWHELSLDSFAASGGEVVEHISEYEMSSQNAAHVLLAALWVHRRLSDDTLSGVPWSVRGLAGPVFVGGSRVGNISKGQAEELGRMFARLGLVAGRAPGTAGDWLPRSADDVLELVCSKWR